MIRLEVTAHDLSFRIRIYRDEEFLCWVTVLKSIACSADAAIIEAMYQLRASGWEFLTDDPGGKPATPPTPTKYELAIDWIARAKARREAGAPKLEPGNTYHARAQIAK